jgi:hypothetical protein
LSIGSASNARFESCPSASAANARALAKKTATNGLRLMPLFPSFFEEIEKKPNYRLSDRSAGTAQTQYDTNRRRDSKCEELGWKRERKI